MRAATYDGRQVSVCGAQEKVTKTAPVSIALILPGSLKASLRIKNSWSSLVKMSFVTTAVGESGEEETNEREKKKKRTDVVSVAEVAAEGEGERGLARSDGSVCGRRQYMLSE